MVTPLGLAVPALDRTCAYIDPALARADSPRDVPPVVLVGRWLLLSSFAVASLAEAQPYATAELAAPYQAISGGSALSFPDLDEGVALVPIGFDFHFYGRSYAYLNVTTNGYLWLAEPCQSGGVCAFGSCSAEGACTESLPIAFPAPRDRPLPSPAGPNATVAPFWDDLDLTTGGQVFTQLRGTAPNRVLVVEWSRVPHGGNGATSSEQVSFEAELHEDGVIALAWGPTRFTSTPFIGWLGNLAIEDPSGAEAYFPSPLCANGDPISNLPLPPHPGCRPSDLRALTNHRFELRPIRGAELSVSLTAPALGTPGRSIDVRVDVHSIGVLATGSPSSVDLYLSADRQVEPGRDTLLGSFAFGALAAGATLTTSIALPLAPDLAAGTYYVGAFVDPDDTVLETSDHNNTAVSEPLRVGPDITGLVTSPMLSGPGETLSLSVNVRSLAAPVGSVDYALYLSADGVLDPGDQRVASGRFVLDGASNLNFPLSVTLSSSISPATYRLALAFDPQDLLTELDESNNIYVSQVPLAVRLADLVADPPEAEILFLGRENRIQAQLRNGGGATAADFYGQLYLAGTPVLTLINLGPLRLAPGEARSLSETVLLDPGIPPGSYSLGLMVDSTAVISEERETNNLALGSQTVIVRWPAPDFRVVELSAPERAAAGETLAVSRTIGNDGNLLGGATVRLYLSRDDRIEPSQDLALISGSVSLAPGQALGDVDLAPVPGDLAPGRYWLGYAVDPDSLVDELDEQNNLSSAWPLEVEASGLAVATSTLPQGTVGLPYRVDLSARGGVGAYRWSVSPALPTGLSLEPSSGRIEGLPAIAGQLALTVEVSDGHSSVSRVLLLDIRAATIPLEIITPALPPAFEGRPFEATLVAVGGTPPYLWSSEAPLPEGLLLSASGTISGTALSGASALIPFTVVDSVGLIARRSLVLSVVPLSDTVHFSGAALPEAVLGQPYVARLEAAGGLAPYHFALIDGALPAGLSLAGGQISGTPRAVGSQVFRAQVVDARGDQDTDTFVLVVGAGGGVQFATTSLPAGIVGRPYLGPRDLPVRLEASSSGGGAIHYAVEGGALPPGITLAPDGLLSGAPATVGVFNFIAAAEDEAGQRELRALAIAVDQPPVPALPPAPTGQCGCSTTPAATGPASLGLLLLLGLIRGVRRRSGSTAPNR